jgi:hypothetical protein
VPRQVCAASSGPTILLHGGSYFDFEAPETSAFSIDDIAHGLSQICRFTGQCGAFYSVAEHSIHVSRLVPPEHALAGLLHDAAEAFLGDVSKPLKTMMPDYRAIEKRVEWAVLARFRVAFMPDCVKHADRIMLLTEQRALMANADLWPDLAEVEAIDLALPCWPPSQAKRAFLRRFRELADG